jgi:hypothetical protein
LSLIRGFLILSKEIIPFIGGPASPSNTNSFINFGSKVGISNRKPKAEEKRKKTINLRIKFIFRFDEINEQR